MNPSTSINVSSIHFSLLFALTITISTILLTYSSAYALCPNNVYGDTIVNSHTDSGRPIFMKWYYLHEGFAYQWETTNLTSGSNTVMRLFEGPIVHTMEGYTASTDEVARDANSGVGYASKITGFSPSHTGYYLLVLHAASSNQAGIADLLFNGQLSEQDVSFGGHDTYTCRLNSGEKIHTRYEPAGYGADRHQLLIATSHTGPGFFFGGDHGGGKGVEYLHAGASTGSWNVAFVASYDPFSGAISQIWNDANDDDDEDGLGNLLENSIGTCPNNYSGTFTQAGWDCSRYDSIDTDSDGLSDYYEIFGVNELICDTFGTYCHYESLPLRWWGADPLHKDVFIEVDYDQYFTDISLKNTYDQSFAFSLDTIFQDGTAYDLDNPDGLPGLRLHLDINDTLPISSSNNPVIFFDGGGSNKLPDDGCAGKNYKTSRQNHMTEIRKPFFRYLCARLAGGGGQGGVPGLSARAGSLPKTIAHEIGHNLGLHHGGQDRFNRKPHYVSLMNYRYYPTVSTFTRGTGLGLNPAALNEKQGLGPGVPVDFLEDSPWYFKVNKSYGFVDWNRDGIFNDGLVQGVVNWPTWKGSGAHTAGSMKLTWVGANPVGTPALVRYAVYDPQRLYMFYPAENGTIWYRTVLFPGDCPNYPDVWGNDTCGNFSQPHDSQMSATNITAERFQLNNFATNIYMAARNSSGQLNVYNATEGANGLLFGLDRSFAGTNVHNTPHIQSYGGKLYVVWREDDGTDRLRITAMDGYGFWQSPKDLLDTSGTPITSNTSPTLAVLPTTGNLYLLTTDSSNQLRMHYLSGAEWLSSSTYAIPIENSFRADQKPAMVWHPYDMRAAPNGPGFWLISYPKYGASTPFLEVVYLHSTNKYRVGKLLDNKLAPIPGTSISYLFEPSDNNLHAAFARIHNTNTPEKVGLYFMPYADGIVDARLGNDNDCKRSGGARKNAVGGRFLSCRKAMRPHDLAG